MIRSISVSAGLAIVLICSAAAAQSSALPAPLSIEDALQLARRERPELTAAAARNRDHR